MMVVWIKCLECKHFAAEQTGSRFDCLAFLPQKGIPAQNIRIPLERICKGAFKFERADEEALKKRAKLGFVNIRKL